MSTLPPCPLCSSPYTYEVELLTCPECGHEWSAEEASNATRGGDDELVVTDANGVLLQDGDSITVIKDLKVKGSSSVVKVGTKVKGIRLVSSNNGHNIDCKITGIGSIALKSEFVKKS